MNTQTRVQIAQQHTLSYSQIQSLNILAMTTAEFSAFCQQEQIDNPLLEQSEPNDPLDHYLAEQHWLNQHSTFTAHASSSPDEQRMMDIPYHDQNELQLFLLSQVNEKKVGQEMYRLLYYLINCLDEYGFLCISPEQLAAELKINRSLMQQAVNHLQSLEPAGVGARDITDCLLLQLERTRERTPLMERILYEHLEEVANAKYRVIAQSCGVSVEQAKACVRRIAALDPHPCADLSSGRPTEYLSPDLIAHHNSSGWDIEINDQYIGELRMNSCYLKLAERAATQEEREYFSNKIEQARTTLRMIEQRRQTILSVTKEILYQQTDFALLGRAPRTLTQQQVAYTLGIHTSTVSRAIRGKYIQLPRGVFPLYIFFHTSAGVHQKSSISREQVKRQVQQLIIHEDPHQPLRDQDIADQLTALFHLPVSRRVVAKYRSELGIKNVYDRQCG